MRTNTQRKEKIQQARELERFYSDLGVEGFVQTLRRARRTLEAKENNIVLLAEERKKRR